MKRQFGMILRLLALCLAALTALSLAGCSAARRPHASLRAARTVATAGDVEIRYDEVYFLAKNYVADRRAAFGADVMQSEAEQAALRAFVEQNLVTRGAALRAVAADYDISADRGDVGDAVQAYMEDLIETEFGGDRNAYIAALDEGFLTDHYFRTDVATENYLATAVVKAMIERGEIDTTDAAFRARLENGDFVRTIQVFLSKSNGKTEAQNHNAAARIVSEVRTAGDETARYEAMRAAVGGPYNNDYADTGDGYYFARGEMDEKYEEAAFALALYDVSDVLETENGYYVLMRLPLDDAYVEKNLQTLKEQSYFIPLNAKVEARLAGMSFSWTKTGAALDLSDLPPIRANGGAWLTALPWIAGGLLLAGAVSAVIVVRRKKRGKASARKKKKDRK